MSLINRPLNSIQEVDLQELVSNQVREAKTVEYKQALPGDSKGDRKEFLYDVSSFANASGGDLIYGMKETAGVASDVCGLQVSNVDSEILRLEGIIRTGIEPRIPGLGIRPVALQKGTVAIVIRVPGSFALPHVVKLDRTFKFYSRTSAGKYPLDVAELRALFALSETTAERIRNFRVERLGMIVAGESPVMGNSNPKTILHIVPAGAFDPARRFDLSHIDYQDKGPKPMCCGNWGDRYNFDGLLIYSDDEKGIFSYAQVFHHGSIEAVEASYIEKGKPKHEIRITVLEDQIATNLSRYLNTQQRMGVEPPLFIMLSLLGVAGYKLGGSDNIWGAAGHPIDRNDLIIPEVMVEEYGCDPYQVMRPIFDAIWNAGGHARDLNYDAAGNRIKS
jgi:hypothetical protein